jgi:16S rRNA (cytosine967-C5)-methyltransferase
MEESLSPSIDEAKQGLPARQTAIACVEQVVRFGKNLDEALMTDRARALDERALRLTRAIALTTLRHRTRILRILSHTWDRKPPKRAFRLLFALETGAAQILFMGVPESAAVDLSVSIVKKDRATTRFAGFANAVLRRVAREQETLLEKTDGISPFPDWLEKRLRTDFGKNNLAEMGKMLLQEPYVDIRLKSARSRFPTQSFALAGGGYRLTTEAPVKAHEGYETGEWWVQDTASAQIVRLLGDISGKTVADCCAAPGGKTMQLASAGALVTAIDDSASRVERLRQNLNRTGLQAKIVVEDLLKWTPEALYDIVLLDAPCSATGTIRRHPDILWNTQADHIEKLVDLQLRMIERAVSWVRPGGIFIYANCSLLKAEGENLVSDLKLPEMQLEPFSPAGLQGFEKCINRMGAYRALPHHLIVKNPWVASGMDGFFAVRFRRQIAP